MSNTKHLLLNITISKQLYGPSASFTAVVGHRFHRFCVAFDVCPPLCPLEDPFDPLDGADPDLGEGRAYEGAVVADTAAVALGCLGAIEIHTAKEGVP